MAACLDVARDLGFEAFDSGAAGLRAETHDREAWGRDVDGFACGCLPCGCDAFPDFLGLRTVMQRVRDL